MNLDEYILDDFSGVSKAGEIIYQLDAKKVEAGAALGDDLLAKAAAEDGAIKTESGLVLLSLVEGDGASPKPSDAVEVMYEGMLVDGTVFDSS